MTLTPPPTDDLGLVASDPNLRVWLSDLDRSQAGAADLTLLSEDERARAERFHFEVHRRRFVACRALLRRLIAAELDATPHELSFLYGPFGKPMLAGEPDLRFNVAHSDRYALIGFTRGREIGLDIEKIRPLQELERLAETAFSRAERAELNGVPQASRAEAFFNGWTRKEAYIKARGEGLDRLADFDVSLWPPQPVRLRRVDGEPDEPARWALSAPTTVPGFAAAVCVEAPATRTPR